MKNILTLALLIVLVSSKILVAQCSGRYQSPTFGVDRSMGIVYEMNINIVGQLTTLTLDIHEPHNDMLSFRPLIFFTHGGSFGVRNNIVDDVDNLSHRFAKIGYITVSINYKLGFHLIDSTHETMAAIRAFQDKRSTIRFFKMDRSTANTYRVDTSQIWVGGSSVGAITALQSAYMDKTLKIPSYHTTFVDIIGGLA